MLKIPEALQKKYNRLLIQKEISTEHHSDYKKWLRFYLDFCEKDQICETLEAFKKKCIQPSWKITESFDGWVPGQLRPVGFFLADQED